MKLLLFIYLGEELERWFRLLFEIITILYYYNTTYFPIKWCKTVNFLFPISYFLYTINIIYFNL